MIITVGGEYGCGSRECAEIAANKLGYRIYDDEIVKEAFKVCGTYMDESTLRFYDESEGSATVDEIAQLSEAGDGISEKLQSLSLDVLPLDLLLDAALRGALERLADNDNCIILGRCANYYLRNRKNVITLFFADTEEHKTARIMKHHECDEDTARRLIKRMDKRRAEFYSYFTGEKWDDAGNYDFRIKTDALGEKGSAEMIANIIAIREKQD